LEAVGAGLRSALLEWADMVEMENASSAIAGINSGIQYVSEMR
jgi:hypothetical protein